MAEEIQESEKVVIKQYEYINKTKKKGIISIINERGILRSSIGLGFFENYHKDIKAVCKKNEEDFR